MEKKGHEVVDLDLSKIDTAICDHFVICHGDSNTQVSAIADSVEKRVKDKLDQNANHREGTENAMWVLIDFDDIIVHIFQKQYRDYYKLEELWGDAQLNKFEEK